MTTQDAEIAEAKGRAAYEARRRWTRTDTARWLNDRSAPVLAWLRRLPGEWPAHSRQMGYWLKDEAPERFGRVHRALEKLPAAARDAALPGELLR